MIDETGSGSARGYTWYEAWQEVFLHPAEQSFHRILADPAASARRAFIWVAIMALAGGLLQAVVLSVTGPRAFGDSFSPVIGMVCGAIGAPVAAVIGLAISTAIYHWIARLFGGKGTYDNLVYASGAISAPVSLVSLVLSALVTPLSLVGEGSGSLLSLCIAPISLALGIYALVLLVLAVKAVEGLDTGKAVLTVLLPTIILFVLTIACVVLALVPVIMQTTGGLR